MCIDSTATSFGAPGLLVDFPECPSCVGQVAINRLDCSNLASSNAGPGTYPGSCANLRLNSNVDLTVTNSSFVGCVGTCLFVDGVGALVGMVYVLDVPARLVMTGECFFFFGEGDFASSTFDEFANNLIEPPPSC